jgi:hypothetical protein
MTTLEWRTVDKSTWPKGPWQDEPDKKQWRDAATGLPCLIVRGPVGALCGYVGVTADHPLHGKSYEDVDVEVHGGLTYAEPCAPHGREDWERFRAKRAKAEAEARRHPQGDAARFLAANADCFDDYEAWVAQEQASAVCHLPAPGEPDSVFWFGFDCAHAFDRSPGIEAVIGRRIEDNEYRDLAYVEAEVARLALQLHQMR